MREDSAWWGWTPRVLPIARELKGRGMSLRIVETKAISQGYGGNARGLLTLTPDGRMSAIVVDAKRHPPAHPTATDAEAVSLFRTMVAYAGTYRVQGNAIIIHVEISSEQTITGTDQTRFFKLDGDG